MKTAIRFFDEIGVSIGTLLSSNFGLPNKYTKYNNYCSGICNLFSDAIVAVCNYL